MAESFGADAMETTWAPQAAVFCEGKPCADDDERIYAGDIMYTCGKFRSEDPDDMLRFYRWNSPTMAAMKPGGSKVLLGITDETHAPGDVPNKLIRVQVSGLAMLPLPASTPLEKFAYGCFVLVSENAEQLQTPAAKRRRPLAPSRPELLDWRPEKLPVLQANEQKLKELTQKLTGLRAPEVRVPPRGNFYRHHGNAFEQYIVEKFGRSELLFYAQAWALQITTEWKRHNLRTDQFARAMERLVAWLADVSRNWVHEPPPGYVCLGRVRGHVEDKHSLVIELTRSTWSKNPARVVY